LLLLLLQGLAAVVGPLASIQYGAIAGDPVALSFVGLNSVGASQSAKEAAAAVASAALPQLQVAL
jgi:hypothetical protein